MVMEAKRIRQGVRGKKKGGREFRERKEEVGSEGKGEWGARERKRGWKVRNIRIGGQ